MFGLDSIPNPLEGAPFGTALELCLVIAFVAWFLSLVTREFSWIDRLGSLCPPLCCLIVAFATDVQWARVNVMGAGEDVARPFLTTGIFRADLRVLTSR
ncbi:MAG: hypothetical protein OXQ94_09965 [Gemmatimonadota bacterium]|nr:hypothetical protein [Gemmatimonadota bacterium]MDE2871992.1 hypothetical protein [Gemmatimonadota bacterium]